MNIKLVLVAACALIDADDRVLLTERPAGKSMAGLWEFPGGKLEAGERPEETLIRELKEELGIVVREPCLAPLTFASHAYEDFHLLIIQRNRTFPPELRSVVRHSKLEARICVRSSVQTDELAGLYNRAEALVFPSLYEGFGLPVLEAMACGCPVLCSNVTSLPEIAGEEEILAVARTIGETERAQAVAVRAGRTLHEQLRFADYLAERAKNPALTFRQHLRGIRGAIEE